MQDGLTLFDPAAELRAIFADLLLLQLIDAGAALEAKAPQLDRRELAHAPAMKMTARSERLVPVA